MGVSLTYTTTGAVAEDVRRAIEAEAEQLNETRRWWCEGLILFTFSENPDGLTGDTKLFRHDYETSNGDIVELDEDDDTFMAWRDAAFIASTLARWAQTYDLTWALSVLGDDIGQVTRDGP